MLGSERKLIAIMFSEVVNYTELLQRDHSLAHTLLEKYQEILRQSVSNHKGREIRTVAGQIERTGLRDWVAGPRAKGGMPKLRTGESMIEFESPLDATLCAVDVHHALHEHKKGVPKEMEILVRTGIHFGEAVHRDDDVFGEAVNVSSRIEPLAESGEICISEQVYSIVRDKIPYSIERLPTQNLERTEFPMEIYKIVLLSKEAGRPFLVQKNRLAVLPLSNISPDPKDAYFADGMTEELITVLSQVQGLRVIARTSVDHYKGKEKRISQIGKELEVGSIMEGSVRMAPDRLRVTVQLIDPSSEEHVWAESYERRLEDIFAIQSDIARKVAEALKVKLLPREEERLDRRSAENVSAYTSYLKGRTLLGKRKRSEMIEAKELFESAISQDPTYAPAYAGLADAYFLLGDYWALPVDMARKKATELLSKAIQLDPDLAEAHASLARDLANAYRHAEAEAEFKRALSLNPSYAIAHMWYASTLGALGRSEEQLEHFRLAEELDPFSTIILMNESWVMLMHGMEAPASEKLKKLIDVDPDSLFVVDGTSFYHYLRGDPATGLAVLDAHPQFEKEATIIADYALLRAANGDVSKSQEWLDKFLRFPETTFGRDWFTAVTYGELGDTDKFFLWANRSVEKKEMRFSNHRVFRPYQKMRNDPRWGELLARVNLKP